MPRLDTETDAAPDPYALDVQVPFGQSVRVGLFVSALSAVAIGWWLTGRDVTGRILVRGVLTALGIGSAAALLVYVFDVLDERWARHEARRGSSTRLEVERGEMPGRPIVPVTLDLVQGSHHALLEVDITPELQDFAKLVMVWREDASDPLGLSFAEASAGKCLVTSEEFVALRDEMMDRGLLRWKNPAHHLAGYQFRAGFDEAMRYVAEYEMEG